MDLENNENFEISYIDTEKVEDKMRNTMDFKGISLKMHKRVEYYQSSIGNE